VGQEARQEDEASGGADDAVVFAVEDVLAVEHPAGLVVVVDVRGGDDAGRVHGLAQDEGAWVCSGDALSML